MSFGKKIRNWTAASLVFIAWGLAVIVLTVAHFYFDHKQEQQRTTTILKKPGWQPPFKMTDRVLPPVAGGPR